MQTAMGFIAPTMHVVSVSPDALDFLVPSSMHFRNLAPMQITSPALMLT